MCQKLDGPKIFEVNFQNLLRKCLKVHNFQKKLKIMKHRVLPVILALAIVGLLYTIEYIFFESYGAVTFLFAPLVLGFLPVVLYAQFNGVAPPSPFKLGLVTLASAMLIILLAALDGILCLAMATPIAVPIALLGSWIGKTVIHKTPPAIGPTLSVVLLLGAASLGFDLGSAPARLLPVRTAVQINASAQTVWDEMLEFDTIQRERDWLFKTGISYPVDAHVIMTATDTVRYCNFSTGSFVEPITTWDPPRLLAFDVREQPVPMSEMNPFYDIHPSHLETTFLSRKGQLKLTEIGPGLTELEGTTWYEVHMGPEWYWRAWSDFIIHRIHLRVLNTVKFAAEE